MATRPRHRHTGSAKNVFRQKRLGKSLAVISPRQTATKAYISRVSPS